MLIVSKPIERCACRRKKYEIAGGCKRLCSLYRFVHCGRLHNVRAPAEFFYHNIGRLADGNNRFYMFIDEFVKL